MLDCCSQGTFISTDEARKLKAEGVQTTIKIKTLNGEESQETEAVSGLKVSKSSGQRMWIDLPVTYTKEDLPVDDEDVATPEKIRKWKYLERIAGEITQGQGISIGLLIGGNCSKALEPLEVIPSEQGGSYAFKTLLGWCIVGTIGETTFDTAVACNRISVQDKVSKNVASHYFARETEVRDIGIEQMLKKIYTAEFNDNGTSRAAENTTKMSTEDRKFLDLMERECSKERNHYKLSLPLRNPDSVFPNNRRMAELRLKNLKKRFIKDKQYHKDYTSFMEDMMKKGYTEKSAPKANQQGKTWFIPHQGVYHPS